MTVKEAEKLPRDEVITPSKEEILEVYKADHFLQERKRMIARAIIDRIMLEHMEKLADN